MVDIGHSAPLIQLLANKGVGGRVGGGSRCVRVVCLPFFVPQYSCCTPILSILFPFCPKSHFLDWYWSSPPLPA